MDEKKATPKGGGQAHLNLTTTKRDRILHILRTGVSLNRFEAERHGDHALNSTIAVLRADGNLILGEWETVPTRFGKDARVLRYRYAGRAAQ